MHPRNNLVINLNPIFSSNELPAYNPSLHSPHSKTIRYVGTGKKVLDVGCASGYMAHRLSEKGCYVVGIEIDKASAEIASQYCRRVIVGDIEGIEKLPFQDGFFDVILLGDVLEHLKRPDLTLIKLRRYLASGGFIIASIPNVARIGVRLKLLFGKFDYEDSGILSKGHLRFFTLKAARKLFETTGYVIVHVDYTGLASRVKFFPTLFAYQFIIIAQLRLDMHMQRTACLECTL